MLKELGRLDEALASYDEAVALRPDRAEARYNRGGALQGLGRLEEALASYEEALAIKANHVEALVNRGVALRELDAAGRSAGEFRQGARARTERRRGAEQSRRRT